MSVLKIKDSQGNWVGVPSIKGDKGERGLTGQDGISPTVTITPITGGHRITITDADGEHSADVMDGTGNVDDVQINGTSIVEDGVANVPIASNNVYGVTRPFSDYGTMAIGSQNTIIGISPASDAQIKAGAATYKPIAVSKQHLSTFYGLAKASGDTTQSKSSNAVGVYTEEAKIAIQKMLGIYEAPWELIEDFTLEEAGTFDKTAEPDGTPYNFRQVFIKVTYAASLETVASGYGLYYFYDENNNDLLAETGRYAQNTAQMFKHIFLQKNANMATLMHTRITSVGSYAMVYNKSQGVRIPFGNITRIRTNGTEPMGARIQIYAQRAY